MPCNCEHWKEKEEKMSGCCHPLFGATSTDTCPYLNIERFQALTIDVEMLRRRVDLLYKIPFVRSWIKLWMSNG